MTTARNAYQSYVSLTYDKKYYVLLSDGSVEGFGDRTGAQMFANELETQTGYLAEILTAAQAHKRNLIA